MYKFYDFEEPLVNFDKIEFKNPNELNKLFSWRDNNKDLVRNFNFVLEKGVIDLQFAGVKIIFRKTGNDVFLDMITKNDEGQYHHFHTLIWKFEKTVVQIHPNQYQSIEEKDYYEENTQSLITVFASTMAFMEHYKEYKEIVKSKRISNKKSKGSKKNNHKNNRKIGKIIYSLNIEDGPAGSEKREYHLDDSKSWFVRGHWRQYKNGNKVWVKPYKKGNTNENENPITYRF